MQIGDVVYLKSGSPKLTVIAITDSGRLVDVSWFDESQGFEASFPLACLQIEVPLV